MLIGNVMSFKPLGGTLKMLYDTIQRAEVKEVTGSGSYRASSGRRTILNRDSRDDPRDIFSLGSCTYNII